MAQKKTATLVTGATTLTVVIDEESQVSVTGTFTTITLSSEGVTEKTISADEIFASAMTDMVFTMTSGTGPAVVKVNPLRVGNISKFELTA